MYLAPLWHRDNASVAKFFVFSDPLNNILGTVILPVQRIHMPIVWDSNYFPGYEEITELL